MLVLVSVNDLDTANLTVTLLSPKDATALSVQSNERCLSTGTVHDDHKEREYTNRSDAANEPKD